MVSCSNDDKKNEYNESCEQDSNTQKLTHDNEIREYISYVPDSYDGSSSVPLVLNFHGFGGKASDYMNYADLRTLAESEIFILVYPQGSCLDGSSHWNACPTGDDNKSDADDFGFVEAIINEVAIPYNIDLEKIYASGYSNGGMMAYGLANYKSDLIAAVAVISGAMLDCYGPTNHPIPVIQLHGTADSVIPYNGNNDYNSVQSVLDYWIDFNNTTSNPTISIDNNEEIAIEHYQYGQGNNGSAVEHYKYIEGNHVWFSNTYQGKNTAELIWNFISKYDINGLR
jgi:polyhydroxybutyrate depolymerase